MARLPFALQLYTVRDHMAKDIPSTLRRVKGARYDFVELAGTGSCSPAEWKKLLVETRLTAVSNHFGLEEVTSRPATVVETCKTLGLRYAVVPHANAEDRQGWIAIAHALDKAGQFLREAGIRLCYHNHAHEFRQLEGKPALDWLFDNARPENLAAEIDTFWVQYGGSDPVEIIRKYRDRCPLLHVKDMAPEGEKPIFADLGTGTMDWPRIFQAANGADIAWYIVEQDECRGDSLESARVSAQFMARQ